MTLRQELTEDADRRDRDRTAFSVATVIPTYNPGTYLDETLRSLERQTRPPAEVIVVDDGSEVPVQLPDLALPIRLVRTDHGGISSARNTGVRASTSPLVHICDHDDLVEPAFYERVVGAFIRTPALDVVHTACGFVGPGGYIKAGRLPGEPPPYSSRDSTLGALLVANPIASVGAVLRRSVFDELGGYEHLDFVQDWNFWLRAAMRGKRFACLPEPLAWHRVHPHQQSRSTQRRHSCQEAIDMLVALDLPVQHRWRRAGTVADLRLRLARRGSGDADGLALRPLIRALGRRPRSAVRALLEGSR